MPYQSVVDIPAHLQLKLGMGGSQGASVDHLNAKYVPLAPILYQAYLLIMISVHHVWQCGNSFVCLLVYWHKEP